MAQLNVLFSPLQNPVMQMEHERQENCGETFFYKFKGFIFLHNCLSLCINMSIYYCKWENETHCSMMLLEHKHNEKLAARESQPCENKQ
jgi:hypothetical protein